LIATRAGLLPPTSTKAQINPGLSLRLDEKRGSRHCRQRDAGTEEFPVRREAHGCGPKTTSVLPCPLPIDRPAWVQKSRSLRKGRLERTRRIQREGVSNRTPKVRRWRLC